MADRSTPALQVLDAFGACAILLTPIIFLNLGGLVPVIAGCRIQGVHTPEVFGKALGDCECRGRSLCSKLLVVTGTRLRLVHKAAAAVALLLEAAQHCWPLTL